MRHFIIVFIAGIVTLAVMLALYRPELLEGVWLWVIGLIGPIIGGAQEVIKSIQKFIKRFTTDL